jgi:hypothetical protein
LGEVENAINSFAFEEYPMGASENGERILKRAREVIGRLEAEIEEIAGPYHSAMSASPSIAERFLRHPDPGIQFAALNLLARQWGTEDSRLRPICENIIGNESDERLVVLALHMYGCNHKNSRDRAAGAVLARIVSDETRINRIRSFAYYALCMLSGRTLPSPTQLRLPNDVNWSLVSRFHDGA